MSYRKQFTIMLTLCFLTGFIFMVYAGNFTIDYQRNTFLKDGIPFRYVSGSIHYFRVLPDYWEDRLRKMRIGGLNALQTYVPWNVHEPSPGNFTFSGPANLPSFLQLANNQQLVVLLRIGPYICGEWEFGGFPAWLLRMNKDMILRTSNPSYMHWVEKWLSKLLSVIKPYLYANGGPVVMVQIENEYGSYFACDADYMRRLYQLVYTALGRQVVVYTTDGDSATCLQCGTVPGAYATVDFGITGDPGDHFKIQREFETSGPLVNSEFYSGWMDHWGYRHSHVDWLKFAECLYALLKYGANVNIYMFEGGTNFGFMNGANAPPFLAVPTSYDYDAPLSESGDITDKYLAIRQVISNFYRLPPNPIPPITPKGDYGWQHMQLRSFKWVFRMQNELKASVPPHIVKLWLVVDKGILPVSTIQDALDILCPEGPVISTYPLSMEQIGHYYGFMMYRHRLHHSVENATIQTDGVRDRGYVMLDQMPVGLLYGMSKTSVRITATAGQVLDILIENMGRVGYGRAMNSMTKGLVSNATLNGAALVGWEMFPIHLENIVSIVSRRKVSSQVKLSDSVRLATPSIYTGRINLAGHAEGLLLDTFLDVGTWTKGQAFINDFNLGRYWPQKGPQVTLYVAAAVLSTVQTNHIFLFELEYPPCHPLNTTKCAVRLSDTPNISSTPV